MPLCFQRFPLSPSARYLRLPPALRAHFFSTTSTWQAEPHSPNYYEILNVPITASTAEIKKQFYALSMRHHPDRNPKDPDAHSKFSSISSAYQTLSNSGKRARYDHDHQIHRPLASSNKTNTHSRGSYVGSRPPSGLRKERGQFRGPPPSFYAHGGYGTSARSQPHQAKTTTSSDPTSFIHHNPVSHFDASSHYRTQTQEDLRRRQRRSRAIDAEIRARSGGSAPADWEGSLTSRFLLVVGILCLGTLISGLGRSSSEEPPSSYRGKSSAPVTRRAEKQGE